jgi:hypothetical protein
MKSPIIWRELRPEINARNLVVLSAAMVILNFFLQGDVGGLILLYDEGYLWYGTIRTALGEIPVRDFQAYDPGRYYWGALWFKLLRNDGILALRISQAVFQFVGLSVAFLLLRRVLRSWLPLITAGVILLVWMFPPLKIYEPVITICAVYFAVLLIENPLKTRHLIAGVFVGQAAFFGRNHGVYCFAAFLLVILFAWWRTDLRALFGRLAFWGLGIVIGYLPMLFMLAFIPGFFGSVWAGILFNFNTARNLPLPVPWPWVPHYLLMTVREAIHQFAIGLLYLAFPAFYLLACVGLLRRPRLRANTLFVASTFVGVAYLHYIFERPHLYYLAWTIPPFIFALIAMPASFSERHRRKVAVIVWSALLIFSWAGAEMAYENYFLLKAKGFVMSKLDQRFHLKVDLFMPEQHLDLVKTEIRGDKMWVPKGVAEIINNAEVINSELIPANDGILIAPYWTGLYPILRKESPTWEIYFLFPQPLREQQKIVEDLERQHTNWAIVCNNYLDGRPELAFKNTHSYVWQYLTGNFEPIRTDRLPRDCQLLHRIDRSVSSETGLRSTKH